MAGIDLYDIYEKYCLEVCAEREQYKPYYEGEVGCCYYCKIDSFISHVEESGIIILKPSDIEKYLNGVARRTLYRYLETIDTGMKAEGKKPNRYLAP